MNQEAQNALLKTLEEPPSRTVVVLTASRAQGLLPTVRSRCLTVALAPMPTAVLAEALRDRGIPSDEAGARAALSGGRPGRALTLDLAHLLDRREALLSDLEALAKSSAALGALPDLTARFSGSSEDTFHEALDLVQSLLRDAALAAGGSAGRALLHLDLRARLGRLGECLGCERAAKLVEGVEYLRAGERFHANRTYAAEALIAAIAGAPVPGSADAG
jgi:DNA polymerase-3 subunit delta'